MMLTKTFQINIPQVVYEVFDDEVVIVNLDTGHYYSAVGVGMAIWLDIVAGDSLARIVSKMQWRFGDSDPSIVTSINQFVDQLQTEAIVATQDINQTEDEIIEGLEQSIQEVTQPFEPPTLSQFTDMQDLLLLDPIHEVDETGWPNIAS